MSHRGKRGPKAARRDRSLRRQAFDLYLPRLERGALTLQECAVLAAYVGEEIRVGAATREALDHTSRALESVRGATDNAVQEAEAAAGEAEQRASAATDAWLSAVARATTAEVECERMRGLLDGRPAAAAGPADRTTTVLHVTQKPTGGTLLGVSHEAEPSADELQRRALANALKGHTDTPWQALLSEVSMIRTVAMYAREHALRAEALDGQVKQLTARLGAAERREHKARWYRSAWLSAAARAKNIRAKLGKAEADLKHVTALLSQYERALESAGRDRARLAKWEATYGPDALKQTLTRLHTAEEAVARVHALREVAQESAPFAGGPTWELLRLALGDATAHPGFRVIAAVACEPQDAEDDHPVGKLLDALENGHQHEHQDAVALVRAYYDAIHDACCPLDHIERTVMSPGAQVREMLHKVERPSYFVKIGA
ncbi:MULTISPECIES: hypothetical protein [unclassified Streptomyces]|uniref:hypothetical protein n=1 Tax=unclassified Streptomyces TaxID=2593676 RepID=UPI00332D83E9